jgi:hypothetical protein
MDSEPEKQIQNLKLKYVTIVNQYDNQKQTFAYDIIAKICYYIDIATLLRIPVEYDKFIDKEGNFIPD